MTSLTLLDLHALTNTMSSWDVALKDHNQNQNITTLIT